VSERGNARCHSGRGSAGVKAVHRDPIARPRVDARRASKKNAKWGA